MTAAVEPLDVLVVYVPTESTRDVLDALFAAGAGRLGSYEQCAWVTRGTGQFRPIEDAQPAIGTLGMLEHVEEDRVEVMLPRALRRDVVTALRAAHPYEEMAFHVIATANCEDA
ncbi:MAG: hypothetical protein M3Z83_07045 [Actinomycetota bacterium]|nr:hypothetical protein [Actinomycetota bacterium]